MREFGLVARFLPMSSKGGSENNGTICRSIRCALGPAAGAGYVPVERLAILWPERRWQLPADERVPKGRRLLRHCRGSRRQEVGAGSAGQRQYPSPGRNQIGEPSRKG